MSSSNWRIVTLDEVSEKIGMGPFGSNIKVETFVDKGVPVISGQHLNDCVLEDNTFNFVTEEHSKKLTSANVYRGDVVFTHAGNIKNVSYIPDDSRYDKYVLSQRQFFVRPDKSKLDAAYLAYFFHSPQGQYLLLANSSQVGVPSIAQPVTYFKALKLQLPTLEEQKRIAKILGDLDRKIELNQRMNVTLEQIGQALFKKYFVDNPECENWDTGVFSDITEVTTGKGSVKSQESIDGKIPLYGANGVMGTSEDFLYNEKLIITGRVGTLGKVKVVNEKAWFSDNVLIIRPNSKFFNYCYYFLKQVNFHSMNRGSTQPLVTQTDLRNLKIKLPDQKILAQFEKTVNFLLSRVSMNDREIVTLGSQRDIVLPKLISGQITA